MSFEVELVAFLTNPPDKRESREETDWKCLYNFKGVIAKQVETDDLSLDDIIIACVISQPTYH